jgi:hypothetical protein
LPAFVDIQSKCGLPARTVHTPPPTPWPWPLSGDTQHLLIEMIFTPQHVGRDRIEQMLDRGDFGIV